MFKASKILVGTLLLTVAVAGFSGCGEDRSNLIPSSEAQQIQATLDGVQKLAKVNCFAALRASRVVQKQVEGLPTSVDADLKRSLLDGVINLQVVLGDGTKCTATGTTDTTTTEPTEPDTEVTPTGDTGVTTPEDTTTEEPKDTDKKDTEKKPVTPDPNPTPTPEPEPKPTPETPPNTDPPADPGPGSGGVSPNQ